MKSASTNVTRKPRASFGVPDSIFFLQSKQMKYSLVLKKKKIMASKTIKLIKLI